MTVMTVMALYNVKNFPSTFAPKSQLYCRGENVIIFHTGNTSHRHEKLSSKLLHV